MGGLSAADIAEDERSGDGRSGDIVRHGFIWNLLNFVFSQGAAFAVMLVLTRKLSVATFGVFGLAALLVDLFAQNARWAAMDVLVQRQDFSARTLSTAFWTLTAGAAALVLLFAIGANQLAVLLSAPDVAEILPVLGLSLLLVPGAAVMDAVLMRDLKFRAQAVRNMIATSAGGAIGLAVAFGPMPEWALVAQRFGVNIATLAILHAYTRWRPTLTFHLDYARSFAARTGQLWSSMTLATAHMRIVEGFIGVRAGVTSLGLLRVSQRFQEALHGPVTGPIQALWVPILSKLRNDPRRAWRHFLDLTRMSAFIALPAFVGLGLVAKDLVALSLDARYADASDLILLLGLSGFLLPVGYFGNEIFAALNRSEMAMKFSLLALCLVTPTVWFASQYGAVAALAGSIAVMGCMGALVTVFQIRLMGGRISEFADHLAAPYLATLAMIPAVLLFAAWLPLTALWLRLVCEVAVGAAAYAVWLIVFHRAAVRDAWAFISYARRPSAGDAAAPEDGVRDVATASLQATTTGAAGTPPMGVDILFSTHNGARTLPHMIEALTRLESPRRPWRIIAVDNASTDDTSAILHAAAQRLPMLVLRCETPGKLPALKLAAQHVTGDLVVFTDDDVIPCPDWLRRFEAFADAHPAFGLFGGSIAPTPIDPVTEWFAASKAQHAELYALSSHADGPVDAEECVFGPNFMIRAEHLDTLGEIDADLGPTFESKRARSFAMGEDTQLMRLLQEKGVAAAYVSEASVGHMVRANQTELDFMLDRAERHGRGFAIRAIRAGKIPSLRALRLIIVQFVRAALMSRGAARHKANPSAEGFRRLWGANWAKGVWREAAFRSNALAVRRAASAQKVAAHDAAKQDIRSRAT